MKFYQKIASIMLFAIYTTSIFGADAATLAANLPVDVEDVINEHQGENGGHWKETGHIKPYSRLLNLISYLTPEQPVVGGFLGAFLKPLKYTVFVAKIAIVTVGIATINKALFKVETVPLKFNMMELIPDYIPLLVQKPLAVGIGMVIYLSGPIMEFLVTHRFCQLLTSRLRKKSPITQICMYPSIDRLSIYYPEKDSPNNYIRESRLLSDIKYEWTTRFITLLGQIGSLSSKMKYEETTRFTTLPGQGIPPTLLKRNGLTYELKNERVNIYIDDSDDYESGDKLSTLPVERVNAFDVSTDGKTIITASEKYGIHKFDLQNTKLINKIMEEN